MENNKIYLLSISETELKELIKSSMKEVLETKNDKELLSFKETCEFLGCSPSALNNWKSQNKIPYKRLGKRIFFNRSEVVEALKDSNYYKIKELLK